MARTTKLEQLSDPDVARRIQSILMNAADGQRSIADDRQYPQLRRALDTRKVGLPRLVNLHPTVDSFLAEVKGIPKRNRGQFIREEFETFLQRLEGTDGPQPANPSSWTGIEAPETKLRAVRALLPVAQASIDTMIAALSEPGPNGGPLLDEREEAIENLRELHRTLGELLAAADSGHLEDGLGQGLAAEAVRYVKRATECLRGDPMPYAASLLLVAVLSACGLPNAGAYLGSVALTVQKTTKGGARTPKSESA